VRFSAAAIDNEAQAIDVDVLHQGYLKQLKRNGGRLFCNAEVTEIARTNNQWDIMTKQGNFSASILVNAAGAWGDVIAKQAGAKPVGLVPKRRSAALIPVQGHDLSQCPLVFGCGETFYFRPMSAETMMVSPADATPVEPHDAWADDMLLAEAIEMFQEVYDIEVTKMPKTWGGLRSFVADGDPVVGFDTTQDGFFWLIGQGGYGIQTSPALSRLASTMILGKSMPEDIKAEGVDLNDLSPARIR